MYFPLSPEDVFAWADVQGAFVVADGVERKAEKEVMEM